MKSRTKHLLALFLLAAVTAALAEIHLDPVFSSGMVLQQDHPLTFFGTSTRHQPVTVTFDDQQKTSELSEKGEWRVMFPPMKASWQNHKMTVTDGKSTAELDDLLIGDVWFCSGQSNMQMPIGAKFIRGWSAMNCEQEVASANYPYLRYVSQRLVFSHMTPLPASFSAGIGWVATTPKVAPWFSATAFFFGRTILQDQHIPVGIIMSSWRGTRIEPWISQQGYEEANLAKELQTIKFYMLDDKAKEKYEEKENIRFESELTAWLPLLSKLTDVIPEQFIEWSRPSFDDSKWQLCRRFFGHNYQTIWFRKHFIIPKYMHGKTLTLAISKPAQLGRLFLNGYPLTQWAATDSDYSQMLQLPLPPEHLNENGDNLLTIRGTYVYNLFADGLTPGILQSETEKHQLQKPWKMNLEQTIPRQQIEQPAPRPLQIPYRMNGQQFYSNLYNGMVDAWTKLPIKGVIWYQGCSNAGQPRYYQLLKALINDWRAKWHQPDMPFIITQLAGYDPAHAKDWQTADATNVSGLALTRDIQAKVADELPNVGLAVTIDIGEANNIHPANKQEVGRRLALEAERIAYRKTERTSGPKFASATPENGAIRVLFTNADSLKTSDGKVPGAFAIAGEDGKFVWADARIDGTTVIVSSPLVPDPKFVRYAYAGYRGDCNLQNEAGLPAAPFRSDAINYDEIK